MIMSFIKTILPTLQFYTASVAVILLFEKIAPSGPCNPGLGVLAFFVFIPVCAWLILKNLYQLLVKKHREQMLIVITHFIAIFFLLLVFKSYV